MEKKISMEKLVNHCKNMGIIFPGSEIYGGLANSWDYGPVGIELKNNVKQAWWKAFVQESEHSMGVDASILMNPRVWEASGHVASFADPLMDCRECKTRHPFEVLKSRRPTLFLHFPFSICRYNAEHFRFLYRYSGSE